MEANQICGNSIGIEPQIQPITDQATVQEKSKESRQTRIPSSSVHREIAKKQYGGFDLHRRLGVGKQERYIEKNRVQDIRLSVQEQKI